MHGGDHFPEYFQELRGVVQNLKNLPIDEIMRGIYKTEQTGIVLRCCLALDFSKPQTSAARGRCLEF
jgi:hypothetical protein